MEHVVTGTVSLREQQLELTRNRILDALAELISRDGLHDFSVQEVADRAGVSHRTIYRHFPDKAALLDGLSRWLDERMAERHPEVGEQQVLDLLVGVEGTWELFEELDTIVEAMVRLMVGAGLSLPARRERTQRIRATVLDALTHLDAEDADAVVALLRTLGSSVSWFCVRHDFDLDPVRARRTFQWATRVLLAELRAGGGPHREGMDRSTPGHDGRQEGQ